ncbi:hypothetical protein TCAL_10793 [Tigriopus californicus]|uniref:Uncharacterized protein n=1 Tax=Tigriopus californicus TaxID=6832 RepID=A0A553PPZ7_TIGCA|nr:hypothetical protein TCAL_10793 [Tigriopus californicus]
MADNTDNENTFQGLEILDYIVIVAYFLFVLGVGLFVSYRSNRSSLSGYFLSSRSMHFIPVGASLFASNIGSGHFIGLAGSGAASGIGVAAFEFTAIYFLMMLGWLFVPVYMASGVYTMPEYLKKRFGGERIRIYLSVLALLLYIFTKISADLFAGALFITQATQIEGDYAIYISILILLAIACLFTIAGGLSAVIWTDFVQTVLMIIGAFILCGIGFQETGGYNQMVESFFKAVAQNRSHSDPNDSSSELCGGVPDNAMHLVRGVDTDLPWTGMLFGLAINSIWYWCSDQVIVQRSLASKDMIHAKAGTILAGYLKLLPLWIMVKKASEFELLMAGRVFVLVLVVISIIWIPIINASQGSQLFVYIQSITSYLAPPICAIYLLAMFWPRCNEPGAFAGLMVGLIVGLIRFGLEFGYAIPPCGSGEAKPPQWWYDIIFSIHYLHFGIILWGITGIVTIVVTLLTDPIPEKHLYRLTFWSRHSDKVRIDLDSEEVEPPAQEQEDVQSLKALTSHVEDVSFVRKCVNFLCGIDNKDKSEEPQEDQMAIAELTPEQKATEAALFLKEEPFWKRIVNLNAVLIMAITAFIIGFYA